MATDGKELLANNNKERDPSGMVELPETTPLRSPSYCMDILPSPINPTSAEHELSGVSKRNENLKKFFAAPQRGKGCSYLKSDERPSEEKQLNTFADDTVSANIIISVNSPTQSLTEFQQSDQPSSPSISGLLTAGDKNISSENVDLVSFHSIKSTMSSDRSPTAVGSRGPTEISPCNSFEEAILVSKLTIEAKNKENADSSISATQEKFCSSGFGLETLDLFNATEESENGGAVARAPKLRKNLRHHKIRKTGRIVVPEALLRKTSVRKEEPPSQRCGKSRSAPTLGRSDI